MKKVQLFNGLTLTYEDSEEKRLEKILTFIKDKSFLFADFDDINNSKTININEFENLVETIVKQIVKAVIVKKDIKSEDFLPAFYLAYLILENNKENDTLIKFPSNMSKDLVLFFLSIKYYNYDIDKICKALFSSTSIEYKNIIEEIKNKQIVNIYNYCLKCTSSYLEEYDTSILDNLECIIEQLTQKNKEYINTANILQNKLDNLRKLSNEELDRLFITFLDYIKAPKDWFDIYNYLKSNNLIKFEYNADKDNGECYFDKNEQIWKIYLISDSTIRTFVTFVHEFSHYVSLSKNKNNNFSLLEFPSIYFENIAAKFLKDSGYEEKIIDEVLNVRNTSNINLYWNQILQLKDIVEYKKYGTFSIEKRIEFYKNWIESMNNFKNNMVQILKDEKIDDIPSFLLTIKEQDPVKMAHEELEEKIISFVQSGLLILNGYQYLIGSLLAYKILDTTSRDLGNKAMINITNQLDKYNLSGIIQLFNIDLTSREKSLKDNEYQKKLSLS